MELAVGERIIVLVDMDCFYVQVEQKLCPEYDNKPCSVVQYQVWKGGSIIAVNYEARAFGVKRGMRGDDAVKLCPEIHNFRVPEVRGKADLTRYREAGASVIEVLCGFCDCVERASVDEAYLDVTSLVSKRMQDSNPTLCASQMPNTFVVGWDKEGEGDDVQSWLDNVLENHMLNDRKLAIAAVIVEELRLEVYKKTRLKCSAGIAHNKMLAKLACGLHKPNKQTVMPHSSVLHFYETLPLHKVRNLGGKLGTEIKEKLNINTMNDLRGFTEMQLSSHFGEKTGSWLYSISRGIEHEAVNSRQLPKSVGCGKNFNGNNVLNTKSKVSHWMLQLALELDERLSKDQMDNRRFAKSLTVTVRSKDDKSSNAVSRTCPIHVYNAQKFASDAIHAINKLNTAAPTSIFWNPPLINLSLTASKFEDKLELPSHNILSYFTSPVKSNNLTHKKDPSAMGNSPFKNVNSEDKESTSLQENAHKKRHSINWYFNQNILPDDVHDDKQAPMETTASSTPCVIDNKSEVNSNISSASVKDHVDNNHTGNSHIDSIMNHNQTIDSFFLKKVGKQSLISEQSSEITTQVTQNRNFLQSANSVVLNSCHVENVISNIIDDSVAASSNDMNKKQSTSVENVELLLNQRQIRSETQSYFLPVDEDKNEISDTSSSSAIAFTENTYKQQNESGLLSELTTLCIKCNQNVPVWEEQEHNDYHMALDIQNELGQLPTKKQAGLHSEVNNSKQRGSKRKTHSNMYTKKHKICKEKINTLDAFIKKN